MTLGLRSLLLLCVLMGGCSFLDRDQSSESEDPIKTEANAPGLKKSLRSDSTPLGASAPDEEKKISETSSSEDKESAEPEKSEESKPDEASEGKTEASERNADDSEASATVGEFGDIDDVAAKNDILSLNKLGVFEGGSTEFKPYETITRGQYVVWLFKTNNAIRREDDHIRFDPTFDPGYDDLKDDHPAYKYVQAFANAGFAVGYEDNTFRPDEPITREEMIAIKVGLDGNEVYEPLKNIKGYIKFADADQISPKYTGYIYHDRFGKDNIGRAFGSVKTFKPQQVVKRHEAAATLSKIKGNTAEKAVKELEKKQS